MHRHHAGPATRERRRHRRPGRRGRARRARRGTTGSTSIGPGLEHQQGEAGQAAARAASRSRRVRRYVTSGSRRPGQRAHRAAALAGDRRVVHGEPAPVVDRRAERAPSGRSAPGRPGPGWLAEPPNDRSGANSLTWCTGTSSGDVHLVGEAGGQLDRRVHGEGAADAVAQPGALQQRRRLDRPAAHEDVRRSGPCRAVPSAAVSSGPAWPARRRRTRRSTRWPASRRAPAATARGQVRLGHALAPRRRGVGAVVVRHPAGDLVVAPAERARRRGAAPRWPPIVGAGHGLHAERRARPRRRWRTARRRRSRRCA